MNDNLELQLKAAVRQQTILALLLIFGWIVRFSACSHLKYTTDNDFGLAVSILFISLFVYAFVVDLKQKSKGNWKCGKCITTFHAVYTCLFLAVTAMGFYESFSDMVRMFACERMAFTNMTLTPNGIVGTEVQCPQSKEFDRSKTLTQFCPFDVRSLEMILANHWMRRLGLFAMIVISVLFATSLVVICKTFGLVIAATYDFLMPKFAQQTKQDVVVSTSDLPPPYQETKSMLPVSLVVEE